MNANGYSLTRLYDLGLRALEGVITDSEFTELSEILAGDSGAVEKYFDLMMDHTSFCKLSNRILSDTDEHIKPIYEPILWQEMLECEKTAIAVEEEKPTEKSEGPRLGLMKVKKPKRKISRLSVYTLILSAAAMLFFMILVLSSPIRPIVATLTDSINAEWISEGEIPVDGEVLRQGELTLARGFAEITFNDGAVVVVEAPAVIELESPKSMFVTSGKVSAVVSRYATGFTVNTLSASIVDLGTEFGVSVGDDGSCRLHMFKGNANLIAGKKGKVKTSQIVNANEARSIDPISGTVRDVSLGTNNFVRRIDSEKKFIWRGQDFNLADVVGGGNGFGTGRPGISIDSMTGKIGQYMDFTEPQDTSIPSHFSRQLNSTKFTMVKSLLFVDSIVFPHGKTKRGVKISSRNHYYEDCPYASGTLHQHISNYNPGPSSDGKMYLNGKIYGLENLPMIYIHATSGITFDMEAMRKAMPGIEITRFKCLMGLNENQKNVIAENRVVKYNFVVLIDGNKVLDESRIRPGPNLVSVDIPISNNQRFLTIFVNDGGDRTANDRCVIGEPILELQSKSD